MNPHRCAVLACLVLWCLCATTVLGQAAKIPAEARTAADASAFEPQIQAFVQEQVQKLSSSDNPQGQSEARDALVRAIDGADVTPAFKDVYTRNLNATLIELAKSENMRVRLNASIVAARAAEKADNTRMADCASAFIHDKNTAVVIWGMSAAKWVLPAIMRDPLQRVNNPLAGELVPALKENPAGPVVQDTYEALTLGLLRDARVVPPGLEGVIPQFFDLLAYRIDLYRQDVPSEPWADQMAGLFLQNRGVWLQTLKPEQQVQAMQLLSDLISVVAQRTVKAGAADRATLAGLVKQLGGSIEVISGYLSNTGLRDAARLVANLDEKNPAEIPQRVARIHPQIIQMDQFRAVTAPPTIGTPAAPADEAPATTGATE